MQLGPAEVLVILVVALLVFGPTRLPEIGRQVGRGMRELRKLQDSMRRDFDEVLADDGTDGRGDPPPTLPPRDVEARDVDTRAIDPAPGDQASSEATEHPPVADSN